MNIAQFQTDPAAYRAELVVPGGRGQAKFADVQADHQRRDFAALDPAFLALATGHKPDVGRYWWERTKGASKDTDLAIMLLWLLAFSPRTLACQVGAADQDQADELRKAAKGILRLNPWLADAIEIQSWSVLNERTDSRCEIVAADVAGSHGARPDLLILNELSHIGNEEFAANLMDNSSKIPHGVVVIATNAGFVPSWQWNWRENARSSERWRWSAFTEPAPWLDPGEIEEARRRNPPLRFARLWGGQWVRGTGDALDAEDIQAAVGAEGPLDGPDPIHQAARDRFTFYGGLDLGVSRDHSALVSLGLGEDGRIRLAAVQSWAPPTGGKVSLATVEAAVLAAHKVFRFHRFFFDTWQAELMGQRLAEAGLPVEGIPFTTASLTEMATRLLERFNSHSIDLYLDQGLLDDLHALRLIDRGTSYRLDSARTRSGHGDKATAFCLALLAAERHPLSPASPGMPFVLGYRSGQHYFGPRKPA